MKTAALLLLAALLFTSAARAQITTVATDSSQPGGAGGRISSFALHNGTVRWMVAARQGLDSVFHRPGFGLKTNSLFVPGGGLRSRYLLNDATSSAELLTRAVSNEQYAYFSSGTGLWRKRLDAPPDVAPELVHSFPAAQLTGPAMLFMPPTGDNVVWAESTATAVQFRYKAQSAAPGAAASSMGELPGLPPGVHNVVRMEVFTDAGPSDAYGLALTASGHLIRWHLPFGSAHTLLASNVTDFCLRREKTSPLVTEQIYIYAATGLPAQGAAAGQLRKINARTGATSTAFDAGSLGANAQIMEVAADDLYLWVRIGFYSYQPGPFGSVTTVLDATQIRRAYRPAFFLAAPGADTNYNVLLAQPDGSSLRSDGQFLYFVEGSISGGAWVPGSRIRRLATDAPVLRLDFEPVALEVTQGTQTILSAVPLAKDRPAIVRAWAFLRENNTGRPVYWPEARLVIYSDTMPEPQEVILPVQEPSAGVRERASSEELVSERIHRLRNDAGSAYLFEVPGSVLARYPGNIRFDFEINHRRVLPETGGTAYANNIKQTINYAMKPYRACLHFVPVWGRDMPDWDFRNPAMNFGGLFARAQALMPAAQLSWSVDASRLELPSLRFGIPPWDFGPFDIGAPDNNDHAACLNWLAVRYLTHRNPPGCPVAHFVGAVPPFFTLGSPSQQVLGNVVFNGLGYLDWLNCVLVRMSPEDAGMAWNSPIGGRTLAHELGHNLGLKHINQNSSANAPPPAQQDQTPEEPYWIDYRYDPYYFGTPGGAPQINNSHHGFDLLTRQFFAADAAGDLMSYRRLRWPSWDYLHTVFIAGGNTGLARRSPRSGGGGSVILASGHVDAVEGNAVLQPLLCTPASFYDPAITAESFGSGALPPQDGWELRQVNAAGAPLHTAALAFAHYSAEPERHGFAQFVPAATGVAAVQVLKDGIVLAESRASATAPVIHSTAPVTVDAAGQWLSWQWNTTDADGDLVLCSVQYSPDDGVSWRTLSTADAAQSFSTSARMLPGGATARLRLLATDGFHTVTALSAAFNMPDRPPVLSISGFTNGTAIPMGTRRLLHGMAQDPEDGEIDPAQLYWVVSGPAAEQQFGSEFDPSMLPPGRYGVTLVAADSAAQVTTDFRLFTILPFDVPEASTAPVVDGFAADEGYAGQPVCLPLTGGGRVTVRCFHHGSSLYVAASGLPFSEAGLTAFGVRADRDASGDAAPGADDVTLSIDETGAVSWQQGNGAGFVPGGSLPSAFASALQPGEGGWSVEFCMPDEMLGGWSRSLGLMFFCEDGGAAPLAQWPPLAEPGNPSTWSAATAGNDPPAENAPPTASAGTDIVESPGGPLLITLDGSGSADPENSPLTYAWTQTGGPAVSLSGGSSARPSFTANSVSGPVTMEFTLTVNDGTQDSAPAVVNVTLLPLVPPSWQAPEEVCELTVSAGTVSGCFNLLHRAAFSAASPSAAEIAAARWIIQRSDDLAGWTEISRASLTPSGQVHFTDSSAAAGRRYYRARMAE